MAHIAAAATLLLTTPAALAQGRCFEELSPAQRAGTADEVYARARAFFSGRSFEDAAALFAFVATEHSASSVGPTAAQLSLESMNATQRPACLDELATSVPRYLKLYCSGSVKANEEICGVFLRISGAVRRLEAEQVVQRADQSRGERARKLYLEGGRLYASLWTDAHQSACKKADKERCARSEEVLYNAARAFQAARDLGSATALRMTLVDPQFHLHETQLARRTPYELGASFQAIGEYDRAAEWYERFATSSPKDEKAPEALSDAVVLRLGLGQRDQAEKNAQLFVKNFGATRLEQTAQIWLALGEGWLQRGEAVKAAKTLSSGAGVILKALPGSRAQLDVLLGKALAKQNKKAAALEAFERAARITGQQLVEQYERARRQDPDEAKAERALGRELTAVGEAQLAVAESARERAAKLSIKKDDAASVKEKRAAIQEVEKLYVKILSLQPVAPPGPVVLAGARLARLRSQLWAQAHLAGALEADALLGEAKAANKHCMDLSLKYEWSHAGSERCAAWLVRHFPAEFHAADPLAPRATWSAPSKFAMPAPLDEDGDPALPSGSTTP